MFSTGKFTISDTFFVAHTVPELLSYARMWARQHERMNVQQVTFNRWRGGGLEFGPIYFMRSADDLGDKALAGIGKGEYWCGQGLSVLNLAPRPSFDFDVGGQALTARDSLQIGGQIASYFARHLRSSNGADSTNAVCVKLESHVGGAFLHALDSSLRVATGGALVAPLERNPLRAISVTKLSQSGDTVFVIAGTTSGGLRAGEWESGFQAQVLLVRTDSTWLRPNVDGGLVGDGYVHVDKPRPPLPPKC